MIHLKFYKKTKSNIPQRVNHYRRNKNLSKKTKQAKLKKQN